MANKKKVEENTNKNTKKKTTNNASTKNNNIKKNNSKKKLEDTVRIRIDDDRVNDVESLDTSFIDGKKKDKVKENTKAKEKILTEKKDYSKVINTIKYIIYVIAAICIVFLGVLALKKNNFFEKVDPTPIKEEVKEKKVKISDNYLFVGDFYIKDMNLDDFLYPYVKVGDLEYTTKDLLDNIEKDVYVYNPSDVFIEIGFNDLDKDVSEEEIISNLEEIITGIKSNRVYANIYIESLYPIRKEKEKDEKITNEKIVSLNKKIKDLTKSLEVNYIDMYKELLDEEELKEDYTDDGINLNEDGYKRVFKVINRIVEDEHEKD